MTSFFNKRQRSHHGFSLVEVVLYFAIAATMILALAAFFTASIQSRLKGVAIMELEMQGADAMNVITQIVRNSDAINTPAAGQTANSLSLDATGSTNDPTTLQITNGVLTIKEGSASPVALTANPLTASQLTIQNLTKTGTPGIVRVQLTLTRKNVFGSQQFSYTKTFTTSSALRQP